MMTERETNQPLYARILGAAWRRLAEPVRLAHGTGVERRGCFRVSHHRSRVLRHLIGLTGLPGEGEAVEVTLIIHPEDQRERWERYFDGKSLITLQWAESGCLWERIGCWELRFTLHVADGALEYRPCGAALRLGRWRLPWPAALALRVRALEKADDHGQVRVRVEVGLPVAGTLVRYEGQLRVNDPGFHSGSTL